MNAERRFQGHSDLPLTQEGRKQARAIARRLADEKIDAVYSSDLRRALETARAVAQSHGIEVVVDARLREFAFGEWEGLTWAEILRLRPELGVDGWREAAAYAPSGGETFVAVAARVKDFYADLATRPLRHVVVVTHAGTLHATLHAFGLRDPQAIPNFLTASLTRIALEGSACRLIALSDVRHLS